jgi:hypothetical protein
MKVKEGLLEMWNGKERGERVRKGNQRGKKDQNTLYECMEIS